MSARAADGAHRVLIAGGGHWHAHFSLVLAPRLVDDTFAPNGLGTLRERFANAAVDEQG
jgi:hypothetical protein